MTANPNNINFLSDLARQGMISKNQLMEYIDVVKQPPRWTTSKPNKLASNWSNKVAWSSADLSERQKGLETYSAEVAMVFEAIRNVASRAIKRQVELDELYFTANFGSPLTDNTQKISINLDKPIKLQIMLLRELVKGKLVWSASLLVTNDTPADISKNIRNLVVTDQAILTPILLNPLEDETKPGRKVKI